MKEYQYSTLKVMLAIILVASLGVSGWAAFATIVIYLGLMGVSDWVHQKLFKEEG